MKRLIIQLAKFGDILQTDHAIKALRQKYPNDDLHIVVRSTFQEATAYVQGLTAVWIFPVNDLLESCLRDDQFESALQIIDEWLETIRSENFDEVINLTYTAFSSYLTKAVCSPQTLVKGFTRHVDGHLALPDEISKYFYSQVGIERFNSLPIYKIFCLQAGVEIEEELLDGSFVRTKINPYKEMNKPVQVLFHIEASDPGKCLKPEECQRLIRSLIQEHEYVHIHVVGLMKQRTAYEDFQKTLSESERKRFFNHLGQYRVTELDSVILNADWLIGFDSLWIHLANLRKIKTIFLQKGASNFFETGPLTEGSPIYLLDGVPSEDLSEYAKDWVRILKGQQPHLNYAMKVDTGDWYFPKSVPEQYAWGIQACLAVHFGYPKPVISTDIQLRGLGQILDLCKLGSQTIGQMRSDQSSQEIQAQILNRIDEAIMAIGKLVPELQPLVRWFEAEKIAVAPDSVNNLISQFDLIYGSLDLQAQGFLNSNSTEDFSNEQFEEGA